MSTTSSLPMKFESLPDLLWVQHLLWLQLAHRQNWKLEAKLRRWERAYEVPRWRENAK